MIWTSRFLFLNSHTTMCLGLTDFILANSIDPVNLTAPDAKGSTERAIRFKGTIHEHLLAAETFFNRRNQSILDFEKIFVGMRNPYGLELARYQCLLDLRAEDACPARKIAVNGCFRDFLEYAPLHDQLPPRLDRYFEVLGKAPENLVILRYESLQDDVRRNLGPYLNNVEIDIDIADDRQLFERIYDVESEAICYRRHKWFFDKGHYSRMAVDTLKSSVNVSSISVHYLVNRDRGGARQDSVAAVSGIEGIEPAPTVSIHIVLEENSQFLQQALASVYQQTFTDWELLLVYDGATDRMIRSTEDLAALDPRVRCLRHEDGAHQGVGASLNLAYRHARGEFVARLAPEDAYASETAIAEQVAIMRSHPEVAVVCGTCDISTSWNRGGNSMRPSVRTDEVVKSPGLAPSFIEYWNDLPQARLERLSAIAAVGYCEPCLLTQDADSSLWLKLALRFPIYLSSRSWLRLGRSLGSTTSGVPAQSRSRQEALKLYQWADAYIEHDATLKRSTRMLMRFRLYRSRLSRKLAWRHKLWNWLRSRKRRWLYLTKQNFKWLACRVQVEALKARRRFSHQATGNIRVDQRTIWIEPGPPDRVRSGSVELSWFAQGADRIDIRVGSVDGALFLQGAPSQGKRATGRWVEDRARFYLQESGAEDPGAISATLDVVQVRVRERAGRRA